MRGLMSAIGLAMLLGSSWPSAAQVIPPPAPLTLTSIIPRHADSIDSVTPDDFLSEVLELNPDGAFYPALRLWGANAPSYPAWVGHPQWSAAGDWLGLTFRQRGGGEGLAAYNIDFAQWEVALSVEAGFSDLSRLAWRRDLTALYVSGQNQAGQYHLLEVALPSAAWRTLTQGRWPALPPDESALLYLDEQDRPSRYDLASATVTALWPAPFSDLQALAWSPDGASLAYADATGLQLLDLTTGQTQPLLTALTQQVMALAWSPDGLYLVWVWAFDTPQTTQVLELEIATGIVRLRAEHRLDSASPDPRLLTGVSYQRPGAFLPINSDQDGL
jgi:hypothetical protein